MATPELISPLFSHYDDLDTVALYGLPGTDFCSLAAFRLTINCYRSVSHHMFTLPAAIDNARKFEQITKPDMFVLKLKLADFHGIPELLTRKHDTGRIRETVTQGDFTGGTITRRSVQNSGSLL